MSVGPSLPPGNRTATWSLTHWNMSRSPVNSTTVPPASASSAGGDPAINLKICARTLKLGVREPIVSEKVHPIDEITRRTVVGRLAGLLFIVGGAASIPANLLFRHPQVGTLNHVLVGVAI